jgi:hypothetical protein
MSETRGLEKQAGGDGQWPSQALIQLECAFTLMNAVSGENLSSVFLPTKFKRVALTTHGRRNRRGHGPSAVLPDDCDMHLGRERPLQIEPRDRVRGVAEGVAHAPDAPPAAYDRARRTGAAKKAARQARARTRSSQRASPNPSTDAIIVSSAPPWLRKNAPRGDDCSETCCPHLHFSLSPRAGRPEEGDEGPPQ